MKWRPVISVTVGCKTCGKAYKARDEYMQYEGGSVHDKAVMVMKVAMSGFVATCTCGTR